MKTERARELYTEYAEGTLSPALSQALEQHFEADPDARADYEQFQQVFALLDEPLSDEVEVPLGFRAKVLELAAEEHARREAAPTRRATISLTGWFAVAAFWRPAPGEHRHDGGIRRHGPCRCIHLLYQQQDVKWEHRSHYAELCADDHQRRDGHAGGRHRHDALVPYSPAEQCQSGVCHGLCRDLD